MGQSKSLALEEEDTKYGIIGSTRNLNNVIYLMVNPKVEPASELLKRIKEEKERLVKEKKIKKQKPLPPIMGEEIPFELPKGWTWCRLGALALIRGGKRIPKGYSLIDEPTKHKYIRVLNMKELSICNSDLKYIDEQTYQLIKKYTITKDDLYITIAGTIGRVGIVPEKFHEMNLTENAAKITLMEQINNLKEYIMYLTFRTFELKSC